MDTSINTQRIQGSKIPNEQLSSIQINGSAMPMSQPGQLSLCASWTTAVVTDLVITTTPVVRLRKVAAKGHVAFVAYVPGAHAWSPPVC